MTAVSELTALLGKLRETAKQNAELTPEQDAVIDQASVAAFAGAAWDPNANS